MEIDSGELHLVISEVIPLNICVFQMRLLIWFPRRIKGVTEEEDVVEDEEDAEEDVEEDADEEGDVVVVEEVDLALRDVFFKKTKKRG